MPTETPLLGERGVRGSRDDPQAHGGRATFVGAGGFGSFMREPAEYGSVGNKTRKRMECGGRKRQIQKRKTPRGSEHGRQKCPGPSLQVHVKQRNQRSTRENSRPPVLFFGNEMLWEESTFTSALTRVRSFSTHGIVS